jgi:hypothetical protein
MAMVRADEHAPERGRSSAGLPGTVVCRRCSMEACGGPPRGVRDQGRWQTHRRQRWQWRRKARELGF